MTAKPTFECLKDVGLVQSSGSANGGIGAGNIISVGFRSSDSSKHRAELEFDADYAGAISVSKATLRLKVTNQCANVGATVKFWVENVTHSFQEGSFSDICGVGSTNAEVWPGQSSNTTNRVRYDGSPSVGDVLNVDVTALVEAHRASITDGTSGKLRLRLIAADATTGYDESNAARYFEFWAHEAGNDGNSYKPRIEVELQDHHAPNAPLNVTPATTDYQGPTEQPVRVERSFTVRGRFSDLDNGDDNTGTSDWMTADQLEFQTVTGTVIDSMSGVRTYADNSLNIVHPVVAPVAYIGQELRGRVRTRDRYGLWGTWTSLGAMRIRPNSQPTAPTNLRVQGSSPATPDYTGTHNDPDPGSSVSRVETQVYQQSASGIEMYWNDTTFQPGDAVSGPLSTLNGSGGTDVGGGTSWRVSHGGTALVTGLRFSRRHRTVDQFGAVGKWSDIVSWVVTDAAIPQVTPSSDVKQDNTTPAIGAVSTQNISGFFIEAYSENDLNSKKLWDSGEVTVSPAATTATTPYGSQGSAVDLVPGQPLWVRVKVRLNSNGALSDWSGLSFVWLNSLPFAPVVTLADAVDSDAGYLIVGSQTPRVLVPYADRDLPNDAASAQQVRVFVQGAATPLVTVTTTANIVEYLDIPTTLQWEHYYEVDARYADSSGTYGPRSERVLFRVHRPPSLVVGATTDFTLIGSVLTTVNPRPTLTWLATFYGGTSQAGYEVAVDNVTGGISERVLDTGFVVDTTAASYRIPAYTLADNSQYTTNITVTDSLGISSTLDGNAILSAYGEANVEETDTGDTTGAVTTGVPADAFGRTLTDTWGSADTGGAYTLTGTAADFDVSGTQGTIAVGAAGQTDQADLLGVSYDGITVVAKVKTNKLAVGGTMLAFLTLHTLDATNHYRIELWFNTDQTMDLRIASIIGGTRTLHGTFSTALTHSTGTFYQLKGTVGFGAVQAKAWLDGSGEPGSWQLSVGESARALTGPGGIGMGARLNTGVTNAPVTFTFDDMSSTSP